MNITDNLIRIKEGKDNIIKSLKNKGVSINDNTLINEIPTIIDNAEIGGGGGDTPVQPDIPELVQKYEGASVFRIEVPTDDYEFAINLCNDATKATYDVDWGDGSLETTLTTDEQHHTYSKKGTYDVNIYNISKDITLGGTISISGISSVTVYYLFNNTNNDYWLGNKYNYQKDNTTVTNILIGNKITKIGEYAFSGCKSLISINIPDSLTSIGNYAFSGCDSLTSINIPKNVTSIADSVFSGCKSLISINIPDSLTSIGSNVFQNCSSLQSVVIGNSVTSIANSAFGQCFSLQSVVIPDNVTSIGSNVFYQCTSLQSVVISESVTSIENYAFGSCSSLQSVVIGNSVTSIANSAFYNCTSLQSITCHALTAPTITNSSFSTSSFNYSKRYLYVPKDSVGYNEGNWKTYLIDKGWELRYIEDRVKTPTTLKLKTTNNFFHNLQAIGQTNLIDYELINNEYIYNFDDKIIELIQYTFYNKVLKEIELPEGLEILNNNAFKDYQSLQNITISEDIVNIGQNAFYNCTRCQEITCKALTAPTIYTNTFVNIGNLVPSGTKKVLRIPQNSSGYDEGYWKSTVLDKGYTLEYI